MVQAYTIEKDSVLCTRFTDAHDANTGMSNTWHATTLKVARDLLPYFINMLHCNFKYRYVVHSTSGNTLS